MQSQLTYFCSEFYYPEFWGNILWDAVAYYLSKSKHNEHEDYHTLGSEIIFKDRCIRVMDYYSGLRYSSMAYYLTDDLLYFSWTSKANRESCKRLFSRKSFKKHILCYSNHARIHFSYPLSICEKGFSPDPDGPTKSFVRTRRYHKEVYRDEFQ